MLATQDVDVAFHLPRVANDTSFGHESLSTSAVFLQSKVLYLVFCACIEVTPTDQHFASLVCLCMP